MPCVCFYLVFDCQAKIVLVGFHMSVVIIDIPTGYVRKLTNFDRAENIDGEAIHIKRFDMLSSLVVPWICALELWSITA